MAALPRGCFLDYDGCLADAYLNVANASGDLAEARAGMPLRTVRKHV